MFKAFALFWELLKFPEHKASFIPPQYFSGFNPFLGKNFK